MRIAYILIVCCFAWVTGLSFAAPETNLIAHPGFEQGMGGWHTWSRTEDALKYKIFTVPSATECSHYIWFQHNNDQTEWSLKPLGKIAGQSGDVFQLSCQGLGLGKGRVILCVSLWDANNQNKSWSYGSITIPKGFFGKPVQIHFVIPDGVTPIQPRVISNGIRIAVNFGNQPALGIRAMGFQITEEKE